MERAAIFIAVIFIMGHSVILLIIIDNETCVQLKVTIFNKIGS